MTAVVGGGCESTKAINPGFRHRCEFCEVDQQTVCGWQRQARSIQGGSMILCGEWPIYRNDDVMS